MNDSRLIVALDFSSKLEAMMFVDRIEPALCKLKVGKQLFSYCGPDIVEKLIAKGFDVFLDLKFHDIPNTVHQACKAAVNMGVWMVNVHALGGQEMMNAARSAVPSIGNKHKLIAVTVLTSTTDNDLKTIGINITAEDMVYKLAGAAKESGLDGVVCSAQEAVGLRRELGEEFCLVTPGIRPANTETNDQKRIQTPFDAIKSGSDYLVVGRPVTQAEDPLASLNKIVDEINSARI